MEKSSESSANQQINVASASFKKASISRDVFKSKKRDLMLRKAQGRRICVCSTVANTTNRPRNITAVVGKGHYLHAQNTTALVATMEN